MAHGQPEQALAAFQRAIDLADAGADGHVGQARAYLALDRGEDAADSLEVALALDPESVAALQLLARVRRSAGADDEYQDQQDCQYHFEERSKDLHRSRRLEVPWLAHQLNSVHQDGIEGTSAAQPLQADISIPGSISHRT